MQRGMLPVRLDQNYWLGAVMRQNQRRHQRDERLALATDGTREAQAAHRRLLAEEERQRELACLLLHEMQTCRVAPREALRRGKHDGLLQVLSVAGVIGLIMPIKHPRLAGRLCHIVRYGLQQMRPIVCLQALHCSTYTYLQACGAFSALRVCPGAAILPLPSTLRDPETMLVGSAGSCASTGRSVTRSTSLCV